MALESVELDGFWPRDRDGINAFPEDNVMASTLLNLGVNHASLPAGIHAPIPDEMKDLAEDIARLSVELEEEFDFQGIFLGGDNKEFNVSHRQLFDAWKGNLVVLDTSSANDSDPQSNLVRFQKVTICIFKIH